jgi:hypothetical protein
MKIYPKSFRPKWSFVKSIPALTLLLASLLTIHAAESRFESHDCCIYNCNTGVVVVEG